MIYYWKSNSDVKKKFEEFIIGINCVFLISGLWIGAISDKYGKFTISTAGEYNQGIMGPEYMGYHPLYEVGLIEPLPITQPVYGVNHPLQKWSIGVH